MIYLIGAYDTQTGKLEAVKVGFTAGDANDRLRSLQTGTHLELRIIGVFDGKLEHEAGLHRTLAPWRLRGEWFSPCGIMASLMATETQPPAMVPAETISDLDAALNALESAAISGALKRCGGVAKRAAVALGITFRSMRYRLDKHGLRTTDDGDEIGPGHQSDE